MVVTISLTKYDVSSEAEIEVLKVISIVHKKVDVLIGDAIKDFMTIDSLDLLDSVSINFFIVKDICSGLPFICLLHGDHNDIKSFMAHGVLQVS